MLARPNRDNALTAKLETLANEQSAAKQQAKSREEALTAKLEILASEQAAIMRQLKELTA